LFFSCAGICYYRRGGECRIALSASYLTLRPRKDLVETLLVNILLQRKGKLFSNYVLARNDSCLSLCYS